MAFDCKIILNRLSPLENLTSTLSENILKFCIDNFERYIVISFSTHKRCYIVHSDFIIQFSLIHINWKFSYAKGA